MLYVILNTRAKNCTTHVYPPDMHSSKHSYLEANFKLHPPPPHYLPPLPSPPSSTSLLPPALEIPTRSDVWTDVPTSLTWWPWVDPTAQSVCGTCDKTNSLSPSYPVTPLTVSYYSGTSLIRTPLKRNTCLIRTTLKSPGIITLIQLAVIVKFLLFFYGPLEFILTRFHCSTTSIGVHTTWCNSTVHARTHVLFAETALFIMALN